LSTGIPACDGEYMVITRAEATSAGTSDDELRRLVASGAYVKLLRGVYADAAEVAVGDEARHRLRVLAMARRSEYAASHVSAAVLHGLPVSGADLSEIHSVRLGVGGNRHASGRQVHSGRVAAEWLTSVDGAAVTTVARTVVDMARTQPRIASLVAADAALHRRLCSPDDLTAAARSVTRHRGARRARAVVDLADGRSESPGETWTRMALNEALPQSEIQIEVFDVFGDFVGRVDGGYPELGVLWEYDGRGKYTGRYDPNISAVDAVLAEKRRESRLTELGWIVIRIDASDLRDPARLRARVTAALQRAQRTGIRPSGSYELTPRWR